MAQEVELKLCVDPPSLSRLLQSWLPNKVPENIQQRDLANTYFDTADLALHQRKVALRLREQDGQVVQTLKTKGASLGGLHQRGEWEWPVAEARLDPSLLRETAFPAEVDTASLVPVFRTDFRRTGAILRYGHSQIELAFDQGNVIAGEQSQPLAEVELELKQGEVADLFALADELAGQVPVWPSDISKAERGYLLSGAASRQQDQRFEAATPLAERLSQRRQFLYRRWLRQLEVCLARPDLAALWAVYEGVLRLDELERLRSEDTGLQAQFDQVLGGLQQLLEQTGSAPACQQADAFSQMRPLGQLALALGRRLVLSQS